MNKEIATEYKIRKFENQDSVFIIDIFNYYIQNSFAAYSEIPIGYEAINYFKEMTKGYHFYVIETNFRKLAG